MGLSIGEFSFLVHSLSLLLPRHFFLPPSSPTERLEQAGAARTNTVQKGYPLRNCDRIKEVVGSL